jgi:sodium transport system permease protein
MGPSRGADIRALYARELRSALRERNIVVNSILLPIFLYPFILWLTYTGIAFVSGQTEGFTSRVMLRGSGAGARPVELELRRDRQIELHTVTDPAGEIREGTLDALVEVEPARQGSLAGDFHSQVTYDDSKDRSEVARLRVKSRLGDYRDRYLLAEAQKAGLSPAEFQGFWIDGRNLATSRQMGQFLLGLMLPLFLIIMLSAGSMHPAIDCTAGEREKSTWETLLTVATARSNVVIAKYLYVSTMASVAGILNLGAMLFSMKSIMQPLMGERIERFSFEIPLSSLPLIALVTVLLALFVAAAMMILASFARTFREGQSMVTPFYLLTLLPVMFLQIPGLEFTPTLAAIPVVNVTMVFREAIAGVYHWQLIGITMAVEIACIVLALRLAVAILRYEDFMLGNYGGGFGRFFKQRILRARAEAR